MKKEVLCAKIGRFLCGEDLWRDCMGPGSTVGQEESMTSTLKQGSEATEQASRLLRMPLRSPSPDEKTVDNLTGTGTMKRQILFVLATLAIAWSVGCHRNAPANDNKKRSEAQPRVEASRYPYTPPTTSDRMRAAKQRNSHNWRAA
jgi:hypothetical protein